jgi:hypothetical protein
VAETRLRDVMGTPECADRIREPMSAPLAGKFQDHYEVLEVDPKANLETIQEAYSRLANYYHPGTPETGDQEKFEAVNLAYEVLCDPMLRREFDKLKGLDAEEMPKFTGYPFFDGLSREGELRSALLCVLYDRRKTKPFTPSISVRHLEGLLDATSEELIFVLWYLKQKGYVASDDKSSLGITVAGMDYLEKNQPEPDVVMRVVRPEAIAEIPLESMEWTDGEFDPAQEAEIEEPAPADA